MTFPRILACGCLHQCTCTTNPTLPASMRSTCDCRHLFSELKQSIDKLVPPEQKMIYLVKSVFHGDIVSAHYVREMAEAAAYNCIKQHAGMADRDYVVLEVEIK